MGCADSKSVIKRERDALKKRTFVSSSNCTSSPECMNPESMMIPDSGHDVDIPTTIDSIDLEDKSEHAIVRNLENTFVDLY